MENKENCLSEALEWLERETIKTKCRFYLGQVHWAPESKPNYYKLICNQHEEYVIGFEGVLFNMEELYQTQIPKKIKKTKEASIRAEEHLILQLLKLKKESTLSDAEAFAQVVSLLNGEYAVTLLNRKDPTQLLCAARGRDLYSTESDGENNLGISISTFRINAESRLLDKSSVYEIGFDEESKTSVRLLGGIELVQRADTLKYDSLMKKEIFEQPEALRRIIGGGYRYLNKYGQVKLDFLEGRAMEFSPEQRVVLVGCGTSLFAAQTGCDLFRKLRVFSNVTCMNACAFDPYLFDPIQFSDTSEG